MTPSAKLRSRETFDFDWRFRLDKRRSWRRVNFARLSIQGPFRKDAPTAVRMLRAGRHRLVPQDVSAHGDRDRTIWIEFGGVYHNSDVWINDRHLDIARRGTAVSTTTYATPAVRSGERDHCARRQFGFAELQVVHRVRDLSPRLADPTSKSRGLRTGEHPSHAEGEQGGRRVRVQTRAIESPYEVERLFSIAGAAKWRAAIVTHSAAKTLVSRRTNLYFARTVVQSMGRRSTIRSRHRYSHDNSIRVADFCSTPAVKLKVSACITTAAASRRPCRIGCFSVGSRF